MHARQQDTARPQAYALALEELGLEWHWDGNEPVRSYVEREHPHLLRAYDADFLVNAIECVRKRVSG
jgi:hypothetical protein